MTKPPLQFRACAGFANRFRALASAMCAAEDVGRRLEVFWPAEPGIFVGPFRTLFQVSSQEPRAALLPSILEAWPAWANRGEILLKTQEDWDKYAAALVRTGPPAHPLKSYYRFYTADETRWLAALRSWRPQPEHDATVERLLATATRKHLIGLHIRRGDNTICKKHSPTHYFLQAMDVQLRARPDTVFFVASDDQQERHDLLMLYGSERILMLATQLDRHTQLGGVDAFLDFLALSKCQEIWGSVYSSFSEVAAAYGGVPLKQLGEPYQPAH